MTVSIFELFSIGIGPSSSHTIGPMSAAYAFATELQTKQLLPQTQRVQADLYGSLALTGIGHGTDKAVLMGLYGYQPELIDPACIPELTDRIETQQSLWLLGKYPVQFVRASDLLFHQQKTLPLHPNGMRFSAYTVNGQLLFSQEYYSIGGGFIVTPEEYGKELTEGPEVPYPFGTAQSLFSICKTHQMSIAEIMMANETTVQSKNIVIEKLMAIAELMQDSVRRGLHTQGILPGGLQVKRRAAGLYEPVKNINTHHPDHAELMQWVSACAIAVNEENAAGHRIVTAPTNGAAGIIPAVLAYYRTFHQASSEGIQNFLLTAGAIAILYKRNASISAAEVGCQGETGVASSMAAGALTAVLGGSLEQIERATEIAMEHSLGLTCDPVKGLVQIPCIERNAMASIKALNATFIALAEEGEGIVSLDQVIATMLQTGKDMSNKYKETSQGGLALNVPNC